MKPVVGENVFTKNDIEINARISKIQNGKVTVVYYNEDEEKIETILPASSFKNKFDSTWDLLYSSQKAQWSSMTKN